MMLFQSVPVPTGLCLDNFMGSKIQGFPYPRKTVRVELPDDVELPASTAEVLGKEPQKAVLVLSVPDTVSISTASAPKTTKVVVEDTAEKTVTQPKVSYKVVTPPEEPQSWWDSRLGTVAKWGIGSAGIGGAFGLLSAAFRQDVAEEAHDHLGWVSHLGLPDIFTGVVFGGILGSLVGIIPALLQSDKNTQPPSYVVETTTSADGVVSTRTLHTPTYGGAVGYGNDDGGYYGGGGAGYYRGRGGGGYPAVYYNSGSSDDHFLQNYVTARVVENAVFGGGYGGRGRYYGSGYGDDIHHHHYYYPSSSGSHASSSSSSSTHNHYYGGGSSSSGGGKSRGKGSFFTKSDGSRRSMFGSSKSSRSSGSTHSSGGGGKSRGSGSTGRSGGKK
jgi:hypothetical protein